MKMFSKGKADLLSLAIRRLGDPMRSDLIFAALKNVPNRYLLVKAVSTATRGWLNNCAAVGPPAVASASTA